MTERKEVSISDNMLKTALITGASVRLGRIMALTLAQNGFAVVLHYRNQKEKTQLLKEEIEHKGGKAFTVQADLSKEEDVHELAHQACTPFGPLGLLVNNASTFERDEWDDVTRASWDKHIEANLRAPFILMQHFARQHTPMHEGLILNMLDQRVWSLTPHFVSYTLSKAGLWSLTQTMALAFAPLNIRVNAIGPGPTLPSIHQDQAQFARQCRSVPLGRGPALQEIGRALMSFVKLPSVTGQMLALDGGQHLQWQSGYEEE